MTIYIPLEPHPELRFFYDVYEEAWSFHLKEDFYSPPYKPGDEIDLSGRYKDEKYIVQSIFPVQRDGKFVWEIKTDDHKIGEA